MPRPRSLRVAALAVLGLLAVPAPARADAEHDALRRRVAELEAHLRRTEAALQEARRTLALQARRIAELEGTSEPVPAPQPANPQPTRPLPTHEPRPPPVQPPAPAPGTPRPPPDYAAATLGLESSREQMRYLLKLFLSTPRSAPGAPWPALDGKNFLLWIVAVDQLDRTTDGTLRQLFSPADRQCVYPGLAAYAAVTHESLRTTRHPRLTSYAGRRNAQREHSITAAELAEGAALIADLSFHDGALIGYSDGSVRWLTRRELCLGPHDPIVAGDASRSPLLRRLSSE
jgi:hypothetical protein